LELMTFNFAFKKWPFWLNPPPPPPSLISVYNYYIARQISIDRVSSAGITKRENDVLTRLA
jgi:hypothetical protein